MPSAVPADGEARLPRAGMIDPRGHRFGAGVSAIVLVVAYLLDAPALVAPALLSIGVSATFGLRWSIYGAAWRRIVRALSLSPTTPEHEYPPRFAQTLGSVVLIASLIAFAAVRAQSAGVWRLPWPVCRPCWRQPATALAAGSTSCAGGCRTS